MRFLKPLKPLGPCLGLGVMLLGFACGGGAKNEAPPAPSKPAITAQPSDQTAFLGGTATFSVTATGVPAPEYQWEKNDKQILGATGSKLDVTNVQLTDEGTTYKVTVRNASGSVTSGRAALHVQNTAGNFLVQFVVESPSYGSLDGTSMQSVAPGGSATSVAALPAHLNVFEKWVGSDGSTSTANPLTVTNVRSDVTYTARFASSDVGRRAADIPGIDATGAQVKLSDYAGSVIVLDISAEWCAACLTLAPQMEILSNRYKAQGLKVLSVITEASSRQAATQAVIQNWASTAGLTTRVQNDTSNSNPLLGVAEAIYWKNPAAGYPPTIVIIDKSFVVQYIHYQYDEAAVKAKVEELLAK
jgi:thiol-disulfide isomerase/thioredoxin